MLVKYECEWCGKIYDAILQCTECEKTHLNNVDQLKYDIKLRNENVCDYCKYVYYVYGCEADCQYSKKCSSRNGYKKFEPKPDTKKR